MAAARDSGPRKRTPLEAVMYWTVVLGIWVLIFIVGFLVAFARGLPDTSKLYEVQRQPSITYLDRNGALIAVRGSQYAPPIDVDSLPPYVPAAFVAIEDRRFYHHPGFDPIGMARAVGRNIKAGHVVQGGSTLTQQLAKNLFLTPEQNMRRKVQEIMLAVWLEHKFSKKQILGLYLNRVYFGSGAYGIEAASQRYFNKPAKQLSVGEAALLAGMMKAPSRYSPVNDAQRSAKRASIVLKEMQKAGVITPEQLEQAQHTRISVSRTLATQHAEYFVDWLDQEIRGLVGEPTEDLVVETTLDLPIQTAAERAVQTIVARDRSRGVQQAALVALDGDGRVRALIGGVNYAESQFDRAVDARRQAGSSWKPFVYLTAMERGYTPDTPWVDEPKNIEGWSPQNYSRGYLGGINLETALAQSVNTVAADLADKVGRDNVRSTAQRLGITSKIGTEPATALGAVEVSPLEMAQAYGAFSNGGFRVKAHGVSRIRTVKGRVLYEYRDEPQVSVINNPPLSEMVRMMRSVMTTGTGRGAGVPGYDLAGKTGTTSDYKDAWFVGYTGGFTAAVWVGKDDNKPMRGVSGGHTPAAIWRSFMSAALPRLKVGSIPTGAAVPATSPTGSDPIGNIIDQAGNMFGDQPTTDTSPPASNPADLPPPDIRPQPGPPQAAPKPAVPPIAPKAKTPPPVPQQKKQDPLFF
ncbi:MAG: penicillin-binding protein 1A [Proteobacteria bacterium]|nr:penicillin-binding protein 1A [Pseudomonadota bacterium]